MYFLLLQVQMYFNSFKPYFVAYYTHGKFKLAHLKPLPLNDNYL
jgi:hypothetical protein